MGRGPRKSVKATGKFVCGHIGTLYLSGTIPTCHRRWEQVRKEKCNSCFANSLPVSERAEFMSKLATVRTEHIKWRAANPDRCETWDETAT
jgi:hypothetical protein